MSRHLPRHPARRVPLRLPPLSAADALRLVDLLERLLAALWHAYGDAIAEHQARLGLETPRPRGARWVGRRRSRELYEDF
jgi:hypothetical protein